MPESEEYADSAPHEDHPVPSEKAHGLLTRLQDDWDDLNDEERYGTIEQAIVALEGR